jgi:hypothetical protein
MAKNRLELTLGGGDIIIYPDTVNELNLGYVTECVFVPEKEIAWFLAGVPQSEVEGIPIKVSFGLVFKWHQINAQNMAIALGIDPALIDSTSFTQYDIVPLGNSTLIPVTPYRFRHPRRDGFTIEIDLFNAAVGEPSEMGFPETEYFSATTAVKSIADPNAQLNYEHGQVKTPKTVQPS